MIQNKACHWFIFKMYQTTYNMQEVDGSDGANVPAKLVQDALLHS